MIKRMIRLAATAGFALSIMGTLPTQAKMLVSERYEGAQATEVGKTVGARTALGNGWRPKVSGGYVKSNEVDLITLPVAGLIRGDRGTVELDLVRGDAEAGSEGLFALVGADGDSLFYARIDWNGYGRYLDEPVLDVKLLWHPEKDYESGPIRLNKNINVGKPFNLTFTWGPSAADCNIFLDGKRLGAIANTPFKMKEFVEQAVSIAIGGQPTNTPGKVYDQAASLFKGLYIYDEPLDGADLYANPAKYRRTAVNPVIAAVAHDASRAAGFSGNLIAGNTLGVTLNGTPGATATFDIAHYPDVAGRLSLNWKGWGVYLEDKVFFEPGEVNLRDVDGYRVYGSTAPFDPLAPGMEPVTTLKVDEQVYSFEGLEVNKTFYTAVVAEMRDGSFKTVVAPLAGLPLTETAPGVYTGTKQIAWGERYPRAVVVGHLATAVLATSFVAEKTIVIDTTLTIAVATSPNELKADEKSKSQISVVVTDANGNPVSGHKMKFLLATTSQYTGVVGGGAFTDQVGGSLDENRWAETDLFGRVSANYVAGFAAKTAIIVVRDMTSNDTGAGWVKTYITATAQLELLPIQNNAAMDAGYTIAVTSSDQWLTADGKSQARITAKVALNGRPVEGHNIDFAVSSGSGSIRAVKNTTDRNGEARAVYTAGKKIGIALITATDTTAGISGSVPIELRSDAPAKIAIKIDPEKLPADGRSRAELLVTVTDINDNPNDNVEVEYDLRSGGGRIRDARGVTDRRGESTSEYTAGRSAGMVSIEITVRSTIPTSEETAKARDLALAVKDYRFF